MKLNFFPFLVVLNLCQAFLSAAPQQIVCSLGGHDAHNTLWWGEPIEVLQIPEYTSTEEFQSWLWPKVSTLISSPEVTHHKQFSDEERTFIKKTLDYFSEFCHQAYDNTWYAQNEVLEGVPLALQTSHIIKVYPQQDGIITETHTHDVILRKVTVPEFEGDFSENWSVSFISYE
jgi:hypothetical protein